MIKNYILVTVWNYFERRLIVCKNNKEPTETNNPLIAVYGIYKNEQTFIERFFKSVQTADQIVLCDTGSTDNTNNIINKFIKNHPDIKLKTIPIFVSPWRFDDARNTSLSLVSSEIDICISLDIDEYLMDNWKEHLINQLQDGVTRYYHKFKTFWGDGSISEHWHERIHIINGYTWKLPVHEVLEYRGSENIKRLPEFWMYQEPESKDSRHNYLSLLEQSVKERKDIWKSWSFLASEYLNKQRYNDALKAIDTALEINNSDKSFLFKQKYLVYKAQNKINPALLSLNNAIFYLPERRELYVEKAKYLNQLGRNTEAYFSILKAEKRTQKIIDYHYNSSAWDSAFDNLKKYIFEQAKNEGIIS